MIDKVELLNWAHDLLLELEDDKVIVFGPVTSLMLS